MTLDGGWGYILSTVIGVLLSEAMQFVRRHSDHRKASSDDAASRAQESANAALQHAERIEKEMLKYQAHVAETYARSADQKNFERDVFRKLDEIVSLINTKADKE